MKSRTRIMLATIAVALTLFSAQAGAFEIGVKGSYWFPQVSGHARLDQPPIPGTDVNLDNDLGISRESFPAAEAYLGVGKHHAGLMFTKLDYTGAVRLGRDIKFGSIKFDKFATVESEFSMDMTDLYYGYDILDLENMLAGFSLQVLGQLKYLEGFTEMKNAAEPAKVATADFTAPVPMIGASAHIGILAEILEARIRVAGIGYGGNMIYDALADVSLTMIPLVGVHAGYRVMGIDWEYDESFVDVGLSGPYACFSVSW